MDAGRKGKMEEQTNRIYFDLFIPKVAAGRNITVEHANNLGKAAYGLESGKRNGLIDEFGGLERAIRDSQRNGPAFPRIKMFAELFTPAPKPLFESLFGQNESTVSAEQKHKRLLLIRCRKM